jgi:hypothetical protein
MAEETNTNTTSNTANSSIDETKLADLIKANISSSLAELKQDFTQQQQPSQTTTATEEPDFWDNIINPKVDKKVSAASLQAELAKDQVDFYTSDEWLSVDEWLVEEDPSKRNDEKKALRKQVEDYSLSLARQGRAMPRADIFNAVLGEKLKKDKVKFEENIGKKHKANAENELEKARRGVDITSVMNNFTPESVHKMDWDKVKETYGQVVF